MNPKLRLLARVVKRRVANGEKITNVLADYPKLTEAEKKEIKAAVK